jgi:MSHA biogenesis protein MshQ
MSAVDSGGGEPDAAADAMTTIEEPAGPPSCPQLTRGLVGYWKFDEGQGNSAADSSTKGNTGTLLGDLAWATPGAPFPMSGTAVSFDGLKSYVMLGQDLAPVLGGTATMAFWIKTTQRGDALPHKAPGLAGIEDPQGGNHVLWGYVDGRGGIGVAAGEFGNVASDPMNDDRWHHVVLSRDADSGKVAVSVDGKVREGKTTAGRTARQFFSLGRIVGSAFLKATVDEVRIWDRLLCPAELAAVAGP